MFSISQYFPSLGKRKRAETPEEQEEEDPHSKRKVDKTSNPNGHKISPGHVPVISTSFTQRRPLASLSEYSPRTNTSPPRKQRRVAICVLIPAKPRSNPTISLTSAPRSLVTTNSKSSKSARKVDHKPTPKPESASNSHMSFKEPRHDPNQIVTPRLPTHTANGAYIPAWRRLGLTLANEKEEVVEAEREWSVHPLHLSIEHSASRSVTVDSARSTCSTEVLADLVSAPTTPERSLPRQSIEDEVEKINDTEQDKVDGTNAQCREEGPVTNVRRPQRAAKRVSYVDKVVKYDSDSDSEQHDAISIASSMSNFGEANDVLSDLESEEDEDSLQPTDDEDTSDLVLEEDVSDEEIVLVDDAKPKRVTTSKSTKSTGAKSGKGVNLGLPPLSNIEDIFADMAANAVTLGLGEALQQLIGRPLNVATMCSGTESPLIALQLLSQGLVHQGHAYIDIKHHFSAEIDVVKQGYIERNFQPKLLFRDVREFIDPEADSATTAYGAEAVVPGNLDLLIAGFVCKDLSGLNNNKKSLDDGGESGDTWAAIYAYVKKRRPSVVLIENVKANKRVWDGFQEKWAAIGYVSAWLYCDTKDYYLPQTRQRMYMIAVNEDLHGEGTLRSVNRWVQMVEKLQRPCSSPFEDFLIDDNASQYAYVSNGTEYDWALCKLRNDGIRSDERLGLKRPISRWSEDGTIRPPDFANRKWYNSQVTRVYDAIDIAHLQAGKTGSDSLYKMSVWDVSQNVDRFKASPGIVPCITPSGCDFVSNQQTALSGSQLLLLQGMPYSKLFFARETQKEKQDLAGNAMSTTVIGAAIVSALTCVRQAFRPVAHFSSEKIIETSQKKRLETLKPMARQILLPPSPEKLDIPEFTRDAVLSSRMCNCEGTVHISKSIIQRCKSCCHTACSSCAGNPKHDYSDKIAREIRITPADFETKWRPRLPARLKFTDFPEFQAMGSQGNDKTWSAVAARVDEIIQGSHEFCLAKFRRLDNCWTVSYVSSHAILKLRIDERVSWHLWVKCPISIPGKDPLRKALRQPIARGLVHDSLLEPAWELFLVQSKKSEISMTSSPERTGSWRSRLGLVDYQAETMPIHINIVYNTADSGVPKDLSGRYELLPHCGTAMSSLYKKIGECEPIYLFLDSDPIGPGHLDTFVFSHDCRRLSHEDARVCLARCDASWRPWSVVDSAIHCVPVDIQGAWVQAQIKLIGDVPSIQIGMPPHYTISSGSHDCQQSVAILEAKVPCALDVDDLNAYSWALEQAKTLPQFTQWSSLETTGSHNLCECAPSMPQILWSVNEQGVATAHEDRKAAAIFERAIKTRPAIFHLEASPQPQSTLIRVGINIASLMHRARSRLASYDRCNLSWRLETSHIDSVKAPFAKFELQSNATNLPYAGPLHLRYPLGDAQKKSLAWMWKQECGQPLTITEVEEDQYPDLGWRVEARAETRIHVQGGILADLPSFGKTVTTIALIQSEFERHGAEAILKDNQRQSAQAPGLIETAATLVICPPTLAKQWPEEFRRFLGHDQFENYKVLTIENFTAMRKLSIEAIQQAKVIIVSWSVFMQDAYIAELAMFAAMPGPATTKGRGFDAWLGYLVEEIPARVQKLKDQGVVAFEENSHSVLADRLDQPNFNATVPLKIQHGSAYQSYSSLKPNARSKAATVKRPKGQEKPSRSSTGWSSYAPVLLQMFCFNRVVVDEYHYLCESTLKNYPAYAMIKRLKAQKRWLLSGTPALSNFSDINQIASLLGVSLGRNVFGDGIGTSNLEKKLMQEQTDVESFISRTETMSHHWHQSRHDRAQAFLDDFARQNEPSLEHIACTESLRPVSLGLAHHAVYLELSQHLIGQRMQIKKLKDQSGSDRIGRLRASLENSATAEEALLKSALLLFTPKGESGIQKLTRKREEQIQNAEKELLRNLRLAEGLLKHAKGVENHYNGFKRDIASGPSFGDLATTKTLRRLTKQAQKQSSPADGARCIEKLKETTSTIRILAQELTSRTRSSRFIRSIEGLLPFLSDPGATTPRPCSSPGCVGRDSISRLFLVSQCGHLICQTCITARTDNESCVHEDCDAPVLATNLIKATDLSSTNDEPQTTSYGEKLDSIARLIKRLPRDDQGVVFVPNEAAMDYISEVLHHHHVEYSLASGARNNAAEMIQDFQENTGPNKKKVLVLNLLDESAAGINLVNANHVIFVAPLLAESQYRYDSAMAQAVARCRRYRQEKKVHVYHYAALRTIDVDILEHRHRRTNAIGQNGVIGPVTTQSKTKNERTRFVQNTQGMTYLVPISWLEDRERCKRLQILDDSERLNSLINFSETFENEDD